MIMKKGKSQDVQCMICGLPSQSSICQSCSAKVQGEAVDKKQKIEKKVRTEKEKASVPEVPVKPPEGK